MPTEFDAPLWVPHEYQARGVDWLISHPEAGLFWKPGLGKTSTTLAAFIRLREMGYSHRMLVLAPLKVAQGTWQAEAAKYKQFQHLKVGFAHGKDKAKVLLDTGYDIVVLNYDGIVWAAPLILEHVKLFGTVVFDELTKMKHTNTKRFKTFKACLPCFQFRYGLTGTPAANGLMDLFGQMMCLDLGYRLGKYITKFRLDYFYQKPYDEYGWYISPDKEAKLHGKVRDIAMYIQPEEFLKLPDLIHVKLTGELEPAQMVQYKHLEDEYIMKLGETDVITAANAAVLTSKLRQFTSGAIYGENKEVKAIHNIKLELLENLIEELAGEPIMVAYNFNNEVDRILGVFPNAAVLRGGMSTTAVNAVIAEWNQGSSPILLVQADMVAHGLNLQFGGYSICWYSQTYNLEVYEQLIARVYRQGQESARVIVYHLLIEKTIDMHVAEKLVQKDITQVALLQALKLNF